MDMAETLEGTRVDDSPLGFIDSDEDVDGIANLVGSTADIETKAGLRDVASGASTMPP